MELPNALFKPKLEKKKKTSLKQFRLKKAFLIFWKSTPIKVLIFSYILGSRNPEQISHVSGNRDFKKLIFQKVTFRKGNNSENISYILGNGTF